MCCFFFQIYRELRKREIFRMADQIVEGKRRKMMSDNESKKKDSNEQSERVILSTVEESKDCNESDDRQIEKEGHREEESREDILEREFEKIRDIPRHQEIFQTFNGKLNQLGQLSN